MVLCDLCVVCAPYTEINPRHQNPSEYKRFVRQTELHSHFAFLYGLHPEFAMSPYFTVHKEYEIYQILGGELERRKMNQPLQWFVEY